MYFQVSFLPTLIFSSFYIFFFLDLKTNFGTEYLQNCITISVPLNWDILFSQLLKSKTSSKIAKKKHFVTVKK